MAANIRLGWKILTVTNALAYFATKLIRAKISFEQAQGVHLIGFGSILTPFVS